MLSAGIKVVTFTSSQVGLNLGKIDTNGVRLNFWDLGGQEELQALWDKYYQVSCTLCCKYHHSNFAGVPRDHIRGRLQ